MYVSIDLTMPKPTEKAPTTIDNIITAPMEYPITLAIRSPIILSRLLISPIMSEIVNRDIITTTIAFLTIQSASLKRSIDLCAEGVQYSVSADHRSI